MAPDFGLPRTKFFGAAAMTFLALFFTLLGVTALPWMVITMPAMSPTGKETKTKAYLDSVQVDDEDPEDYDECTEGGNDYDTCTRRETDANVVKAFGALAIIAAAAAIGLCVMAVKQIDAGKFDVSNKVYQLGPLGLNGLGSFFVFVAMFTYVGGTLANMKDTFADTNKQLKSMGREEITVSLGAGGVLYIFAGLFYIAGGAGAFLAAKAAGEEKPGAGGETKGEAVGAGEAA